MTHGPTEVRTPAADLETEIRRLRIRIMTMTSAQLDARVDPNPSAANSSETERPSPPEAAADSRPTRRELVRGALTELAALHSAGRTVPDLGDRILADQLVVLLEDCLPSRGADPAAASAGLEIATDLRRRLG